MNSHKEDVIKSMCGKDTVGYFATGSKPVIEEPTIEQNDERGI